MIPGRGPLVLMLVCACGGGQRDPDTTPGVVPPDAGSLGAPGDRAPGGATLDLRPINRPGEMVVLEELLVPGQVTVLDFYAEWCGPCREVEGRLVVALAGRSGVVIRKIDVGDEGSPVAEHYDVGVLPHLRIYGRDGVLVYALIGDNAYRAGELALEVLGSQTDSRQSTVDSGSGQ